MKHSQVITIEVNGKRIQATLSLDAPGLETEDCLNAQMILAAVASNQDVTYSSRHHKNRSARVLVRQEHQTPGAARPALRLAA